MVPIKNCQKCCTDNKENKINKKFLIGDKDPSLQMAKSMGIDQM